MQIVLLVSIIVFLSLMNVVKKAFNEKIPAAGPHFFSAVACFVSALFFVMSAGFRPEWNAGVLPYAVGFAIGCAVSSVFAFLAIQNGSLSLTSLIISYSLIIPTVFGLVFLNETASAWFYIGLGFLCVSLFLINVKFERSPEKEGTKITWKWILYVLLAFLGNGACSTVQVLQQRTFAGAYKNELMIMALLIVSATLIIFACFGEKKTMPESFKKGWYIMVLCGAANGAMNLFVMMLANRMNASLMYPLISAGSIILTAMISIAFYKEKLSRTQVAGLVLGIAAVVFMNL